MFLQEYRDISRDPTSGLEPLTPAHYEWLALDLPLATTYQYVAYLSRNRDHRGIVHPTAYLPVPVWLQYSCSTLSNRTDLAECAFPDLTRCRPRGRAATA